VLRAWLHHNKPNGALFSLGGDQTTAVASQWGHIWSDVRAICIRRGARTCACELAGVDCGAIDTADTVRFAIGNYRSIIKPRTVTRFRQLWSLRNESWLIRHLE
jgi:hypothetical protein